MAAIEILSIKQAALSARLIRGACIDWPQVGAVARGSVLRCEGWILGKQNVTAVEVRCLRSLLRSTPLDQPRPDVAEHFHVAGDRCGFAVAFTAVELPPLFELDVTALLADGQRVPLATISGRHTVTPPPYDGMRPLLVTALGRSGTTYLLRLLSEHPQIVAHRAYPYETRPAAYWMHLFRVLIQPEPQDYAAWHFDRGDWARPPFVMPPKNLPLALPDYFADLYPPIVVDFCRRAIEDFYRRVAENQGQAPPSYFCEKFTIEGLEFMIHNVYPDAREIFLVRDFRDVLCSSLAFNTKRGFLSFGRQYVSSDEEFISTMRASAQCLLDHYRSRQTHAHLVRYEEIIHRPVQVLGGILKYLGLDASQVLIEGLVERAGKTDSQLEQHRTTSSPEKSIGRWSCDTDPSLQRLCRRTFDDLLPEFGYQLGAAGELLLPSSQ